MLLSPVTQQKIISLGGLLLEDLVGKPVVELTLPILKDLSLLLCGDVKGPLERLFNLDSQVPPLFFLLLYV